MTQHVIEELIRSRRTIKQFKPDPISIETMKELLEVASWAPNHKLREPWQFKLFTGEGKEKLVTAWQAAKETGKGARPMNPEKLEQLKQIPLFVVVTMPVDPRQQVFEEDFAAVGAYIQNLLLAAWGRGIGSLWNTEPVIYSPVFRDAIGVMPGEKVVAILQFGYAEKTPLVRERTSIDEKLTIIDKN